MKIPNSVKGRKRTNNTLDKMKSFPSMTKRGREAWTVGESNLRNKWLYFKELATISE